MTISVHTEWVGMNPIMFWVQFASMSAAIAAGLDELCVKCITFVASVDVSLLCQLNAQR
jgi:hypothetical protein